MWSLSKGIAPYLALSNLLTVVIANVNRFYVDYLVDKCLVQQVTLCKLGAPDTQSLKQLRKMLDEGRPFIGPDQEAWMDAADLVAIGPFGGNDFFSKLIVHKLLPIFHELVGKRIKVRTPIWRSLLYLTCYEIFKKPIFESSISRISLYSDSHLLFVLNIFSTVVSSMLPISSIFVLHYVSSITTRLWITAGFTAIFSLCLALATEARRIENFAATTA